MFGDVYTVDVDGTTNRELFASDNAQMIETFQQNAKKLSDMQLRNFRTAKAAIKTDTKRHYSERSSASKSFSGSGLE